MNTSNISQYTDKYFSQTRAAVARHGDVDVTYAVFMRRPIIFTPRLMVQWIKEISRERKTTFKIELLYKEGEHVGAGEPLVYLSGSLQHLVDLETIYLQKLGPACVAAYNAYSMCCNLPNVGFLAMDARHCAGMEMAELMAYAASVGSQAAKRDCGAVGFIGNATDATAHYFGNDKGMGTMPHALIGYCGSTLRAAEVFHNTFPDSNMTVLVDYFGHEITDSLAVCRRFHELAKNGNLAVRIDTHGGRFVEGLDTEKSYAVLDNFAPNALRQYRTENELRWLVGTGVTAAAVYHLRHSLDKEGFNNVRIVVSSGFDPEKCKVMASANAPINVVGTGSFLPQKWDETYATADVVEYDGKSMVKRGREFLIRKSNKPI